MSYDDYINHQFHNTTETGANKMTDQMTIQNNQTRNSSVTLSMLIAEAVYKLVVSVERGISLLKK